MSRVNALIKPRSFISYFIFLTIRKNFKFNRVCEPDSNNLMALNTFI